MVVPANPATVFLHVGLHKTGTTFLQNLLKANRDNLRTQRVDFPGERGGPVPTLAISDLQGRRPGGVEDTRIAGQWDALLTRVRASDCPTVLLSDERLSLATSKEATKVVEAFAGLRVEVVVTARDLGRATTSAWQEMVKNDSVVEWQEFIDGIKDPARAAVSPARGFWRRQDLAKICAAWESAVTADRIHVVTVPPPGAAPDVLLRRFAEAIGFDAGALTETPRWNNETVGVAGVEVIRRANVRMGGRLNEAQYGRIVKRTLVPGLAAATEPVRFSVPESELPWLSERADATIAAVRARGYRVVGDLDDLRVQRRAGGRRPDDVTDAELLEASLDALALLAEAFASPSWAARGSKVEPVPNQGGWSSRARGVVYSGQRKAVDLADRNRLAAKAMAVILKGRERSRLGSFRRRNGA